MDTRSSSERVESPGPCGAIHAVGGLVVQSRPQVRRSTQARAGQVLTAQMRAGQRRTQQLRG